jgi:hypothetical protein
LQASLTPHPYTGVGNLHSPGIGLTGKGIKVAVIDTGIDYTHPALGGCFGKGCKVQYGRDFLRDSKNIHDPMDAGTHGTHVAGIIAASDGQIQGVAPNVILGAYKVTECDGSPIRDSDLLAALEQCSFDKMDVINISSGKQGWPRSPYYKAIKKLVAKGVIVVAATGNEGAKGLFQVNEPSIEKNVISVGSIDLPVVPKFSIYTSVNMDKEFPIQLLTCGRFESFEEVSGTEVALFPDQYSLKGDKVLPERYFSGQIVLMKHNPGMKASEELAILLKGGASGVIYYKGKGEVDDYSSELAQDMAIMTTQYDNGEWMRKKLKDGENMRIYVRRTFSPRKEFMPMSEFSSWGPGNDFSLKPDLVAPVSYFLTPF